MHCFYVAHGDVEEGAEGKLIHRVCSPWKERFMSNVRRARMLFVREARALFVILS